MTALAWDKPTERSYETGLEGGVLYLTDNSGVVWNGLTSVDEDFSGVGTTQHYFDGIKYFDAQQYGEYAATLRALTYPDEFLEFEGFGQLSSGVFVDDQQPGRFGLSYRTRVGSATNNDLGYKLHIIYNLTADPDDSTFNSHQNSISPVEFGWKIKAVPELVEGFKPTAHFIIDSREVNPFTLQLLEDILYGTSTDDAYLPTISELLSFFLNSGYIVITDHGDGTWSVEGPDDKVYFVGPGEFRIDDVDITYLDDDTYTVYTTEEA